MYNSIGYNLQSEVMESRIRWILAQHAPWGYKLNERLDQVLGGTVLLVIQAWHAITALIAPYAPQLLFSIALATIFGGGMSLIIAFCCDAISFVTFHIQFLYFFFSRIHRFQLAGMSTFSKVIRGKKKNILKKRVDTGEFDNGQLLFGSLAFIVFVFLFQTTLAYYIMFTGIWLAAVLLHGMLLLVLKLVALFPTQSLGEILSDKHRFPSGISLELVPVNISLDKGENITIEAGIVQGRFCRPYQIIQAWLYLIPSLWNFQQKVTRTNLLKCALSGEPVDLMDSTFPGIQTRNQNEKNE